MKTTILFLVLLQLSFISFSQGEFIVEIDRTNGNFTKIGTAIAGITYVFPDDRAFNENTGTFIFPSSQIEHRLYSINTINGAVSSDPLLNDLHKFEFDNTTGILYGLRQDSANNQKHFVSINQVTGVPTIIGNPIPNSSLYSADFSTFDEINHTYIFLDSSNNPPFMLLYTLDASNGDIISNPPLIRVAGENVINITFDNSKGTLYGLLQDNNLQKFFLISINATTGTYSKIGDGTSFGAGGGSATIDDLNQEYIYMYSNDIGYNITTLDISTGNVVYNALILPFTNNDNFHGVEYDRVQQRLFSIHWESFALGIESNSKTNALLTPNPTSDFATISIETEATFTLANIHGQILQQGKFLSGDNILDVSPYSAGLYFINVKTDSSAMKLKLIKQ